MHAHTSSRAMARSVAVHARIDPTKTLALRSHYERELIRRFRKLQLAIKSAMREDKFGLTVNAPAKKVQDFMAWLREQEEKGILEITPGASISKAANESWQNIYLRSAYQKGLAGAANRMRGQGVKVADSWVDSAFYRPIHADAAGLIYTKAYSDLDGITRTMDTQISRTLAQGMIEGVGVRAIAKALVERVDKIGITRARVLARTEIIGAHAEATLNGYEEADAEGVLIESEFSTAGDEHVCPKCDALEGTTYTIQEARGIIPVHPNCRCAWLPVISNPTRRSLA